MAPILSVELRSLSYHSATKVRAPTIAIEATASGQILANLSLLLAFYNDVSPELVVRAAMLALLGIFRFLKEGESLGGNDGHVAGL